jgi:hypothetical protein
MEIGHFTPGRPSTRGPPLATYRPATPAGALGPYLEAYSQTGDLVIDLFCQGPTLVQEAAEARRRALGFNLNRATLLAASVGLTMVDPHTVEAAFTQLAEAHKGPRTLQAHIEQLYRTTCATCGAATVADAFVWERDEGALIRKFYRCANCGENQEAPTDEADQATAGQFERKSLSYWLLLDRAAPGKSPHRDRVASLLELYTSRNLSAVNDLLLKSDGLTLAPNVRDVLDALLLDTLDRATSLRSPDAPTSQPRRLRPPARFIEQNVWRIFEQALAAWHLTSPTPITRAPNLRDLLDQTTLIQSKSPAPIYLAPLSSSQVGRDLPPECVSLMVLDPPRPDIVLWHLSTLWCYWLWGAQAGKPLASLLSRRWLDKDWLWRGLRGALGAVSSLLRPDGRLVGLYSDRNPVILEALTLAAADAGFELVGWAAQPSGGARLVWRTGERKPAMREGKPAPGATVEPDTLSRQVAEQSVFTSINVLRARGEPADWATLNAAVYASLAESGLLALAAKLPQDIGEPLSWLTETIRSALDGAPLRQISHESGEGVRTAPATPRWWLDSSLEPEATYLLSDRVELAVAEILRDLLAVTEAELRRRVCERFPGPQTPDARLVQLCLYSYGDEYAPSHWRLRSEDNLVARSQETEAVIAGLTSLGRRIGFEVMVVDADHTSEWSVLWLDETEHAAYSFAVRTTAVLGDLLFHAPSPEFLKEGAARDRANADKATTPCLTLPGGRAILVGYKLRQDPRLYQQVTRHRWQFLKFRHLRHLVQEVAAKQLDRYAFQAALGLDPIVEQEEAQLSLW